MSVLTCAVISAASETNEPQLILVYILLFLYSALSVVADDDVSFCQQHFFFFFNLLRDRSLSPSSMLDGSLLKHPSNK